MVVHGDCDGMSYRYAVVDEWGASLKLVPPYKRNYQLLIEESSPSIRQTGVSSLWCDAWYNNGTGGVQNTCVDGTALQRYCTRTTVGSHAICSTPYNISTLFYLPVRHLRYRVTEKIHVVGAGWNEPRRHNAQYRCVLTRSHLHDYGRVSVIVDRKHIAEMKYRYRGCDQMNNWHPWWQQFY